MGHLIDQRVSMAKHMAIAPVTAPAKHSPSGLFWQFGNVLIVWVVLIAVVLVLKLYAVDRTAPKAS